MTSFLKKALSHIGLAVLKVPPAARTLAAERRDTQGWLVELIGPSGVGKSTLLQHLNPVFQTDWFFESHAKGLLGHLPEDAADAAYLKRVCAARLDRILDTTLPLENIASIGQRIFEVTRLGLVSKSPNLPRGFIMDDGVSYYFTEQILKEDLHATKAFTEDMAFIFLLPDEAEAHCVSAPWNREELKAYHALLALLQDLGRPTLLLKRSARAENPNKVIAFLQQDVLCQARRQG